MTAVPPRDREAVWAALRDLPDEIEFAFDCGAQNRLAYFTTLRADAIRTRALGRDLDLLDELICAVTAERWHTARTLGGYLAGRATAADTRRGSR